MNKLSKIGPIEGLTPSIIAINEVLHVGQLARRPTGRRSSYEGRHLSVSRHPDAWRQIARLGGLPTWRFKKRGGRFLDALAVRRKRLLTDWGIAQGLVVSVERWEVPVYDEEGELDGVMLVSTLKEALAEIGEASDALGVEAERPKRIQHLAMSPTLTKRIGVVERHADDGIGGLVIAYAEELGLDGVWWRERLIPSALSAPRGCILQERLSEWTRERT